MRIQAEAPATYYTTGLISEKQQGQCLALFKTRPKIFLAVNRIWPFSTPTEICTYLLGKNEDFLYFFLKFRNSKFFSAAFSELSEWLAFYRRPGKQTIRILSSRHSTNNYRLLFTASCSL